MIDLTWWRDPRQRYELEMARPAVSLPRRPNDGMTINAAAPEIFIGVARPQRIVCRTARDALAPYRPLEAFGSIYQVFVEDATDPAGLLRFVKKFGALTAAGLDPAAGEDVPALLRHAAAMRALIDAATDHGGEALARAIGPKGRPLADSQIAGIEVRLATDAATGAPALQFVAPTLLTAIWLQLGQTLAGGALFRRCANCNAIFELGRGRGRRRGDARFCSEACRNVAHRNRYARSGTTTPAGFVSDINSPTRSATASAAASNTASAA